MVNQPLQQKESRAIPSQEELGRLNLKEIQLIHLIRTQYRFGELTVITKDGLPYKIMKTTEYQLLD